MKEKPILFSGPMVQAILEGRKTMTRRVAKAPEIAYYKQGGLVWYDTMQNQDTKRCPRYQPGDILWVREAWAVVDKMGYLNEPYYVFRADYEDDQWPTRWRPSIHMPRGAARLFLRVTDVRVERVQDITLEDIEREGIYCDPPYTKDHYAYPGGMRLHWIKLWDTINAKRGFGWEANPWVWCYTFERCEGGANADV